MATAKKRPPAKAKRPPAKRAPAKGTTAKRPPPARRIVSATESPLLVKMRGIALSFPDTIETLTWGNPHFRVGDKIFCGYGNEKGRIVVGFKADMDDAKKLVREEAFWPAPYVGHKGWVSCDVVALGDWSRLAKLIEDSYELIAPKRSKRR